MSKAPSFCQLLSPGREIFPQLQSTFPFQLRAASSNARTFVFATFCNISFHISDRIPETCADAASDHCVFCFIANQNMQGMTSLITIILTLFGTLGCKIIAHPTTFALSSFHSIAFSGSFSRSPTTSLEVLSDANPFLAFN